MCTALIRHGFARAPCLVRLPPLQLPSRQFASPSSTGVLALRGTKWSESDAVHALEQHECDVIESLVQKQLAPLLQHEVKLAADLKPVEQELRNVEAYILDWQKRVVSAEEHISAKRRDALNLDGQADLFRSHLYDKRAERAAKGDEYKYHAEIVGIDDAAASSMLKHACTYPKAEQKSPLLTSFAKLHSECLEIQNQISESETGAAKARADASDKRAEADSMKAKIQGFEKQKAEAEQLADTIRAEIETVSRARAKVEVDGTRMRAAAAWAQRISPAFLRPTHETLPILLLQRHQAILNVAMTADDSNLFLLRDLICTADELAAFPDMAARLRRGAFSAAELHAMGFTFRQITSAGYSAPELVDAGFSARKLKEVGFDATDLRGAGVTATELKRIGMTIEQIHLASYPMRELKEAGFTAGELSAQGISVVELMNAGFTGQELLDAHFETELIKAAYHRSRGSSVPELLRKGFTLSILRRAGFPTHDLFPDSSWFSKNMGFGSV